MSESKDSQVMDGFVEEKLHQGWRRLSSSGQLYSILQTPYWTLLGMSKPAMYHNVPAFGNSLAKTITFDDFFEVVYDPAVPPENWLEIKANAEGAARDYLRTLTRVAMGPGLYGADTLKNASLDDVEDFMVEEFDHAYTTGLLFYSQLLGCIVFNAQNAQNEAMARAQQLFTARTSPKTSTSNGTWKAPAGGPPSGSLQWVQQPTAIPGHSLPKAVTFEGPLPPKDDFSDEEKTDPTPVAGPVSTRSFNEGVVVSPGTWAICYNCAGKFQGVPVDLGTVRESPRLCSRCSLV